MDSDHGVMPRILQRMDVMDKTVGQLDLIQSSINNVTVKVSDIEVKVKKLVEKIGALVNSHDFGAESIECMNSNRKATDSSLTCVTMLCP